MWHCIYVLLRITGYRDSKSFSTFQVFDMKKFQQNMSRELKRPYPDRRKLEAQCVSVVAFG